MRWCQDASVAFACALKCDVPGSFSVFVPVSFVRPSFCFSLAFLCLFLFLCYLAFPVSRSHSSVPSVPCVLNARACVRARIELIYGCVSSLAL